MWFLPATVIPIREDWAKVGKGIKETCSTARRRIVTAFM